MTFSSPTGATTPVASCADTPLGDEEINSWPASPSGLSSPTLLPIGTDVMAELFDMLRGRTRTQLHELESEANETIRRLWASYCAGGGLSANFRSFKHAVEKTVDEFKEARDEIYVDMACEYGRLQANMVWDALAARDLIPDQYIKLRFEIRDWHARTGSQDRFRSARNGEGNSEVIKSAGATHENQEHKADASCREDGPGASRGRRIFIWDEDDSESSVGSGHHTPKDLVAWSLPSK